MKKRYYSLNLIVGGIEWVHKFSLFSNNDKEAIELAKEAHAHLGLDGQEDVTLYHNPYANEPDYGIPVASFKAFWREE